MRILVVSQQYWPETWRIVDTCEELVKRGHQVTVLCGLPNDQDGNLLPEYRNRANWVQERNGVHIIRVHEHPRKHGDLNLYLKYRSFAKNGVRAARKLPGNFDVVLLNQLSPIMQGKPAIAYARIWQKKVLMYCQDIWPESLSARHVLDSGLTKPIYRHYLKVSRQIYGSMDLILVTSPHYIDYLHEVCSVTTGKLEYLPQYAEGLFYQPAIPKIEQARKHNFVFAGNVGMVQDVETIVRAADLLKENKDIAIHIVGSGSDLANVQKLVEALGTDNIFFHGRVPLEQIPGMYAASDALLVTFAKDPLTPYVVPAKLQTCMASGKPIIAAATGAVAEIIADAKCGVAVEPGDFVSLAREIEKMSSCDHEIRDGYSVNAREFSKIHFDRASYFSRLEASLERLSIR